MRQIEMFEDTYAEHAATFYENVPVEVHQRGFDHHEVLPKFARFWFHSQTPRMAWVIGWACKGDEPRVYFVDIAHLNISRNPVDPPPMPDWAGAPIDPAWVFERLARNAR